MERLTREELALGRQLLTRAHELSLDQRYNTAAERAERAWNEWLAIYGAALLSIAEQADR